MPAYPHSQWSSRDEAGEETAYQEEKTATILDGYGRLVEAESERWEKYLV
jgi:hypothetical protein